MICWFNLATAALCALVCIKSKSPAVSAWNAVLVFLNVFVAGLNSNQ